MAERDIFAALAERAISTVADAERETNWGSPTFGPTPSEELRAEYDAMLAQGERGGASDAEERAELYKAQRDELLLSVIQYRNDMRYPPDADSAERRMAAVTALIAKVTGE